MAVVRWTNLICGALLVVATLGFLIFLPGNLADYDREPEDVLLTAFWVGLLGMLAVLCFANAKRSTRGPKFGWLTLANLASIIGLAWLLVADGGDDPALVPLIALCALGPTVALLASIGRSQADRS